LWPFKNKRVKNSKTKPPNATKAASQKQRKFLVYYFVIVKVQK
jgi:hypothetical protein